VSHSPSILVIEDDPGLSLMMRHRLSQEGFEVIAALSGEDGITQVLTRTPTLMLLDYALPDMLCTHLVERLTQMGCCPPFIIVTGQGDERVAVRTMKLGARDYLIKGDRLLERLPRVVLRACEELERERRLVAAGEEIKRLNTELEERVQTRTAELKAAHQRARLMMQVAEGANQASSAEDAIQIALSAACEQSGAVIGHAWWLRDDSDILVSSGQSIDRSGGYTELVSEFTHLSWPPGAGMPGQVLASRTPCWLSDLSIAPPSPRQQTLSAAGLRSGIFVPVLVEGRGHAVIELFSTEVRPIDQDILEFLTRIGTQLGSVIRRRRAEQVLRRARDIADQANRAKSQFLANMSHEIRTPMNAILGFAQLLQHDSELPPTGREHLQRILHSGGHLLHLIDDVLEMSKIEAGRITIEPAPMDLHSFIRELEAMFRNRADARGLKLAAHIAPDVPVYVLGDARKIRQILINLISNAIKFTDEGEVTIRVSAESESRVRFEIEDTGVGIPREEQQRVFLHFEQSTHTRQRGGTGLGLAISHRFAELMQGQLFVVSQLNKGSRFTLEVPLPPTTDPIADEPMQSSFSIIHTSLEALVVDDAEDNRAVLAELLTNAGFQVQTASSGPEALRWFIQRPPAVVLVDLRMPGMDGTTVCKRLRALPGGAEVPIVMVSASVLPETPAAALQAGADRFLRKPLLFQPLMQTLSELLSLPLSSPTPPPTADRITLTPAHLAEVPAQQRSSFLAATKLGDIQQIERFLIEMTTEPAIRAALTELVDNFQYDQLQVLFAPDAS
jgi:signal transduction histidine kinase/DNA-binding response OmpR family regulator